MNTKNENTSFNITAEFYDNGVALTPATVRYRIHCLTNNRSIRSNTTVTAGQSITIPVTPDDNVILNELNRVELRQMTIETDYDTTSQRVFTKEWYVRNLKGN